MITINYLTHHRNKVFWDISKYFFDRIKEENKSKIKLNILSTNNIDFVLPDRIETNVVSFDDNELNYISKIRYAISQDTEYSVKLDEDCFINNHIWDYMIENVSILENQSNLAIVPVLSNNIPLVDNFIKNFITDLKVKDKIYKNFLNQNMPNGLWGVDYSPLNQYTINADSWDPENFYDGVSQLNHFYKGIHPIRICANAQLILNKYILENFDRIVQKNNYSLQEFSCPYYTNSMFLIKTKEWINVLNTESFDAFDEVQFNVYKNRFNKKLFFVENGFAIHPTYNTIHNVNYNVWGIGLPDGKGYELDFTFDVFEKLGI